MKSTEYPEYAKCIVLLLLLPVMAIFLTACGPDSTPTVGVATPATPPPSAEERLVNDAVAQTLALTAYHETIAFAPANCNQVELDHESGSRIHVKGTWDCKPLEELHREDGTYVRDSTGGKWVTPTPGPLSDFDQTYEGYSYLLLGIRGEGFVSQGEETLDRVRVLRLQQVQQPTARQGTEDKTAIITLWIDPNSKYLRKLVLAVAQSTDTGTANTPTPSVASTPPVALAAQEAIVWTWSRQNEAVTVPKP